MKDRETINLNHLRYFYEVAKAGNMRRAATRIGISQPALSKQIQALEESVGLQLFYRTPQGLRPTADGDLTASYCERLFGHLRDLEAAFAQRRQGSAGRLTIGAVHSIATHLLPDYLRRFRETNKEVRLRITPARSRGVLKALTEHRIDIGLIAEAPPSVGFVWRAFMLTPLVVVTAPDHPFAALTQDGTPMPIAQLNGADMIAFDPPAATRRVVNGYLARRSIVPRVTADCPSIESINELVVKGLGFAILPSHTVETDVANGRLKIIPVANWSLERKLYLVHLAGPPLAPAVQQFADLFPTLDPSASGAAQESS